MNRLIVVSVSLLFGGLIATAVMAQDVSDLTNRLGEKSEIWASYSSTGVQSALKRSGGLGEDFAANSAFGADASTFGFAERSPEARMFLAGTLYAEALAFTQDGQYEAATDRLLALQDIVNKAEAPVALRGYIQRTTEIIAQSRYDRRAMVEFLALLQPQLDGFAASNSSDMQILFQTGAWLVDLSVAATAGDYRYLAQKMRIAYTIEEMERMEAPKGVLDGLRTIEEIAGRDQVEKRDVEKIAREVKRIQSLLG
ncbi:MAG: hypothetical protein GWP60_05670 [Gammaproteobacteria bacterium]|jgi:hypothetical protein|nr:hypothetical protein [Gammaproteobacteria bacterium]HSG96464.1 hypothetical protein [Woeseiaceae bacterium]